MSEQQAEYTIVTQPTQEYWYISLVDDCKSIVTETIFNSRWALVEGYHQLGERIAIDEDYQKFSKGNKLLCKGLAQNIGVSERAVYYAIAFYEKYPSLNSVPEGKNISWNKLITKYLPAPGDEKLPDEEEVAWQRVIRSIERYLTISAPLPGTETRRLACNMLIDSTGSDV